VLTAGSQQDNSLTDALTLIDIASLCIEHSIPWGLHIEERYATSFMQQARSPLQNHKRQQQRLPCSPSLLSVTEVYQDGGSACEGAICPVVIVLMVEFALVVTHNCRQQTHVAQSGSTTQ
jgi:hypothetical protein